MAPDAVQYQGILVETEKYGLIRPFYPYFCRFGRAGPDSTRTLKIVFYGCPEKFQHMVYLFILLV